MNHQPLTPGRRLRRWVFSVLSLTLFTATGAQAQPEPGDTFVHLFEWQWSDVATECEQHLGPEGYAGVQVSPPQEHIQGDAWWTRYQPVSLTIDNSRSGTRAEFIDMVDRCNAEGVDIYVDAVINHMAAGSGTGTNGTEYADGSDYPEFDAGDFHPACDIEGDDYANDADAVRTCRLVGLPDLDTDAEYVRQTLADYLNDLVQIGVAGFRIDASKHMSPADIDAVISRLDGNPYSFQEVIDLGGEAVSADEYLGVGDVTEFNYSAQLGGLFNNGPLSDLGNLNENSGFIDGDAAVVFTDNHDNQRGHGAGGSDVLTYKDGDRYTLGNVFMLAWPYGYPKVMSSFGFSDSEAGPPSSPVHSSGELNCFGDDWQCEHRWQGISNMVAFRSATAGEDVTDWWDNGNNQVAFGRGGNGFVVINGEGGELSRRFDTGLPDGEYCNVIDGDFDDGSCTGATVTVDGQGRIDVSVAGNTALALHTDARTDGGSSPDPEPEPGTVSANSLCLDDNLGYNDPHIYYWSPSPSGELATTDWPGDPMEETDGYHCFDPGTGLDSLEVVFNDNGNAQTDDLTYDGEGCYDGSQWQSLEDCGFDVEEGAGGSDPEPSDTSYICYDNSDGFSNPHLYYWAPSPSDALPDTDWPGVALETDSGYYCHEAEGALDSLNVVFNDNGGAQTDDLSMSGDNTCFQNGGWTSLESCGIDAP